MTFCTEIASAPGFKCQPRWTGIEFTSPDAGALFNGSTATNVRVVARLVPATQSDGGGVLTGRSLSGSTTLNWQTGDVFVGSFTLPGGTGPRTISAATAFDAGLWSYALDASVVVNVDTDSPFLTVVVVDRPDAGDPDQSSPAAWKKDERALVKVTADGPGVSVANTDFNLSWIGAAAGTTPARCACGPNCQCFEVDLAGTTIAGIRGTASLTVGPVRDPAGNPSNVPNASVNITRFKWQRSFTSTTATGIHPVGVSASGITVTPVDEGTSGRIFGVKQDGSTAWSPVSVGLVTSGPALGGSSFWVGFRSGTNVGLQPVSIATGIAGTPDCTAANSKRFLGDIALASLGGAPDGEGAVGVREGASGGGEFRAADGTCNALAVPTSPATFTAPARVVVSESTGVDVYAAGGGGTLWKANLVTPGWTSLGAATFAVAPAAALFFSSGANFVGGGGGVANGGVFSTSTVLALDGGTSFASYAPSGAAQAGPVSVGSDFVIYGDTSGRLVKVAYSAGNFGAPTIANNLTGNTTQDVSPVLGAGSLVYVVSRSGEVFVRNTNAITTPVWSASFASVADTVGQPALDVLRDATGQKQCRGLGVLYLPSSSAGSAALTALLVDSEGLDKNAPWPKYQRDNANTGNASRPLTPWVCPP